MNMKVQNCNSLKTMHPMQASTTTQRLSAASNTAVPVHNPLFDPFRTCGLSSAFVGPVPFQMICWKETCPNVASCTKHHLSLFPNGQPQSLAPSHAQIPYGYPGLDPLSLYRASLNVDVESSLPLNLSTSDGARQQQQQQQTAHVVPMGSQTTDRSDLKNTLRNAIEARQKQVGRISSPSGQKLSDLDSGNESNFSQDLSPPKPPTSFSVLNPNHQRGESTSPKSEHGGSIGSGSSSGYKSPKSGHSILASILRGEDFASSSRSESPVKSLEALTPPSDIDVEVLSTGSSKSPKELTLLKPASSSSSSATSAPTTNSAFSVSHLLVKHPVEEPERTSFTPPYMYSADYQQQFGSGRMQLPPLAAMAPFFSGVYPNMFAHQQQQQQVPYPFLGAAGVSAFRLPQQFRNNNNSLSESLAQHHHHLQQQQQLQGSFGGHTIAGPEVTQQHQQQHQQMCADLRTERQAQSASRSPDSMASPTSSASQSSSPSSASQSLPPTSNAVCVVCEDKASGYHYGVISCEGCKGFFRRTVQKNIEYHCHKDNKCFVNRITRNRCQACRFNKCLLMGMTKESVRHDRNRKRKARDEEEEAELKATARLQHVIKTVVAAHNETSSTFQLDSPIPSAATFLQSQLRDMAGISQFAAQVPGFDCLNVQDQKLLLHSAYLEIVLLRCAFLYCCRDTKTEENQVGDLQALVDCVTKLRDSLVQLEVFNEEVALLSAVCLLCPTRQGLQSVEAVEQLQEPLLEALRVQIQLRKPHHQNVFAKLLMKISDLRTVASLRDDLTILADRIVKTE